MADKEIEFIDVPRRLHRIVGTPDAKTRMYRQIGGRTDFEEWWFAVSEACGRDGAISPGGASMIAQVSRMAVYKRMKEGRITAFLLHEMPRKGRWGIGDLVKRLHGAGRVPAGCYVPVVEVKRWGALLSGRTVTREDESKDQDFLLLHRQRFVEMRRAKGMVD